MTLCTFKFEDSLPKDSDSKQPSKMFCWNFLFHALFCESKVSLLKYVTSMNIGRTEGTYVTLYVPWTHTLNAWVYESVVDIGAYLRLYLNSLWKAELKSQRVYTRIYFLQLCWCTLNPLTECMTINSNGVNEYGSCRASDTNLWPIWWVLAQCLGIEAIGPALSNGIDLTLKRNDFRLTGLQWWAGINGKSNRKL